MIIKEYFFNAVQQYSNDIGVAEKLWRELEKKYSAKTRHYHTQAHLDDMLSQLIPLRDSFENWSIVVFAVAYHDVIYNPLRSDNEDKSALLAIDRLRSMGVREQHARKCEELILATKKHAAADDETNLFTDADLSILGSDPATYDRYLKNIRKEYSIYPDLVYKPGRKKVVLHFLSMDRIFKTTEFFNSLETHARKNLNAELSSL